MSERVTKKDDQTGNISDMEVIVSTIGAWNINGDETW